MTCVLLPALNEAKFIGSVIRQIRQQGLDVIVIDDGSHDDTSIIAGRESATVIRHSVNKGKGAALKTGIRFVVDKGYDNVIMMDADGQHDPAEIPRFINEIEGSDAGIIIGNRMHKPKGMPATRIFCNTYGSAITSKAAGQFIPDALIGYKIVKIEVLRTIRLNSDRYEIDPEMLIRAAMAGFSIGHINVESIYGSEISRINPGLDLYCFMKMIRMVGGGRLKTARRRVCLDAEA